MTRHQLFVQIRKAYFQEALNAADTAVKRADILSGCCGPEPKYSVTLAEARQLFVARSPRLTRRSMPRSPSITPGSIAWGCAHERRI
jgi:hypothetical protein